MCHAAWWGFLFWHSNDITDSNNYNWNNEQDTNGGMVHDCIYLQTYHMHVPDIKDYVDNGMNLYIRIANATMIAEIVHVHMDFIIPEHHVLQDPFRSVKG